MKSRATFIPLLVLMSIFLGCSDDEGITNGTDDPRITITGTVNIEEGSGIPESGVLTAIWSVDGSPDYGYVFGKGTVDFDSKTFTMTLGTPPDEALNIPTGEFADQGWPTLGVGAIVFGDLTSNDPHVLSAEDMKGQMYGGVSTYGIIYLVGNNTALETHSSLYWVTDFPTGYSIGEGVKTGQTHDKFIPTSTRSLVLTIADDMKDFWFPNWK